MATKKELQAQADEAGVEYDAKATKADLEEALAEAGVEVSSGSKWFESKATGVVFAASPGSPTYKRITSKRQAHLYKASSKPSKPQGRKLTRRPRKS